MYYIGVDLGTSAVKLLLMEGSGRIANVVSKEYPLYFPHPGWSEQKPEDWYEQTMLGIKELIQDVDKSQVAGISFGGALAMVISYTTWHSVGWAIIHGLLSWVYVIYFVIRY